MIDPRLQTLRVLRQQGTVTAAAQVLHLTPSTVSVQLRQLARDLDVCLLEASGRRVRLTPAAHTLLDHADQLYADWARVQAALAAHREHVAGELRLCGVASAVSALLAPAAARLRSAYPEVDVDVREEDSDESFALLLADRVDLAVLSPSERSPAVDDPRFEQLPLLTDQQDLLVPAEHPLADRDLVELREAATETWIECRFGDQARMTLVACASAGFTPRLAHLAGDWLATSALVAEGLGVCLVPRLAQLPAAHRVVRVPLAAPAPARQLLTCVRRGTSGQPLIAGALRTLDDVTAGWTGRLGEPGA